MIIEASNYRTKSAEITSSLNTYTFHNSPVHVLSQRLNTYLPPNMTHGYYSHAYLSISIFLDLRLHFVTGVFHSLNMWAALQCGDRIVGKGDTSES